MNIEEYRLYCLSKKGVTESFPFSKLPSILVFKVLGKMFTATNVDIFESISVKSDTEHIERLRSEFHCLTIQPYMSKIIGIKLYLTILYLINRFMNGLTNLINWYYKT